MSILVLKGVGVQEIGMVRRRRILRVEEGPRG